MVCSLMKRSGLRADDMAELLRAVGMSTATILGTSMGGRIAVTLALRHPELVKRLILVSTVMKQTVTWMRRQTSTTQIG